MAVTKAPPIERAYEIEAGETLTVGSVVGLLDTGLLTRQYNQKKIGVLKSIDGNTGIVVLKGTSGAHSGLIPGAVYHAGADGSLTTTPASIRVGIALSGTQLLIDEYLINLTSSPYLSGLSLSSGTLAPPFSGQTYSYSASVGYDNEK